MKSNILEAADLKMTPRKSAVALRQRSVTAPRKGDHHRCGTVVDVFCGVGGLSHGFLLEGFDVRAGIDIDASCRYAYERNNGARFVERSVEDLAARDINPLFAEGQPRILVGCAPCQPFSTYSKNRTDAKWRLLAEFARLVRDVQPDVVSMENVPRLTSFHGGRLFEDFLAMLEQEGYAVWSNVVDCANYGVPQTRKRLVVLASRLSRRHCSPHLHPTCRDRWDAIRRLGICTTECGSWRCASPRLRRRPDQ